MVKPRVLSFVLLEIGPNATTTLCSLSYMDNCSSKSAALDASIYVAVVSIKGPV